MGDDTGNRVLYVDPDPSARESVTDELTRCDPVDAVVDVAEPATARSTVEARSVACVVSEYALPDRDGLDLLRDVRAEDPETPFVLYTDAGDESLASAAIAADVTDYVPKSAGPDRLAVRVADLLQAGTWTATGDERYRLLASVSTDPVAILQDGEFVDLNEEFAAAVGADDRDSLLGADAYQYVHPDERGAARARIERVLDGADVPPTERRLVTDSGETRWVSMTDELITARGRPAVLAHARDITDRKRAERERRETTQRLRAVIEAAPVPVVALDTAGCVTMWNSAAEQVFGWPSEEVMDEPSPIVPDDRTDEFEQFVSRVLDGEHLTGIEIERRTRDGERLLLSLSAAPTHDADGEVDGLMAILQDVTEQRRRAERLDQFASIVSHDLQNPLMAANGALELAAETGDDEYIRKASRCLDRMERLIDELLALARHGEDSLDVEPLSLETIARETWTTTATADATLAVESDRTVAADRGQFQELLENLFRNAVEHGGGGVTVRVGATDDGFYVADDGPGVPPADREKVFERGFSTGEEGTGFGLSIVDRIADAHGWSVSVSESRAGGAKFVVET